MPSKCWTLFFSRILKHFLSLFLDITMDFNIPFINKLIYFSLCIFHLQLFICCQYYDIIFEELVKITYTLECSSLLWCFLHGQELYNFTLSHMPVTGVNSLAIVAAYRKVIIMTESKFFRAFIKVFETF